MGKVLVRRTQILRMFLYVVLSSGAVVMVFPFFWMITSSFKTLTEIVRIPPTWFPSQLYLDNYVFAFTTHPLFRYLLNSIVVSTSITIVHLFTSSAVGYILAKYKFKGKELLFYAILAKMMIPIHVIIIPVFSMIVGLRWINTYQGIVVPLMISSFSIFLMRQFIEDIPSSYIDSARLDGCSEFGIYWWIILPSIKPALATVGIFAFCWSWDLLLWPLIVVQTNEMKTLPLGLASFVAGEGGYAMNYGAHVAASTFALLPIIVAFLFAQKYFIRGITLTGIK